MDVERTRLAHIKLSALVKLTPPDYTTKPFVRRCKYCICADPNEQKCYFCQNEHYSHEHIRDTHSPHSVPSLMISSLNFTHTIRRRFSGSRHRGQLPVVLPFHSHLTANRYPGRSCSKTSASLGFAGFTETLAALHCTSLHPVTVSFRRAGGARGSQSTLPHRWPPDDTSTV